MVDHWNGDGVVGHGAVGVAKIEDGGWKTADGNATLDSTPHPQSLSADEGEGEDGHTIAGDQDDYEDQGLECQGA